MKLSLVRFRFTEMSTIGKLAINGVFECYTLEDKVREPFIKIAGQTAIPVGTYHVIVNWSNRFHRMMPLLLKVPEFEGVRIHAGNNSADTEGCILVGTAFEKDRIGFSRIAFDRLFAKIESAYSNNDRIDIEITNQRELPPTELTA